MSVTNILAIVIGLALMIGAFSAFLVALFTDAMASRSTTRLVR
jgi:hypothetical protein